MVNGILMHAGWTNWDFTQQR